MQVSPNFLFAKCAQESVTQLAEGLLFFIEFLLLSKDRNCINASLQAYVALQNKNI